MARAPLVLLFVVLAAVVGYLAARPGEPVPIARAPREDTRVTQLQFRVAALEDRLQGIELRLARERTPASATTSTAGEAARAGEARPPGEAGPPVEAAPEPDRNDYRKHREEWEQRYREAAITSARLAVLRDGKVQLGRHADEATLRAFLEGIVASSQPASEEGLAARFELGYLARGHADYAAADDQFRFIERVAEPDSENYAGACFQLGWNRRYENDARGAVDSFQRAVDAAGVDPGTKAAARFALSQLKGDLGDADGARAELEQLVEEAKRYPAHGGAQYYARLAREGLADE